MTTWKPKDKEAAHAEGERLRHRLQDADQHNAPLTPQLDETLEEEARRTNKEAAALAEQWADVQAKAWRRWLEAENDAIVDGDKPEERAD